MIRQARPEDEAHIRDCARQAYTRYIAAMGREPAPMLADYAAQIAAGEAHVATEDDGTLLGFIVFRTEGDHVFLENVAVSLRAAGQGVGKALIGFCEAEARRAGRGAVRLYTNGRMTENLSIYPRLGYVETGRRTEDGFDRVYFEKPLR